MRKTINSGGTGISKSLVSLLMCFNRIAQLIRFVERLNRKVDDSKGVLSGWPGRLLKYPHPSLPPNGEGMRQSFDVSTAGEVWDTTSVSLHLAIEGRRLVGAQTFRPCHVLR
jgi:hypothetical protein